MDVFKKSLYFGALALFVYMPFHIFLSQWLSTYTGGLDGWKIAKDVVTAGVVFTLVATVLLTRKYTKQYLWFVGCAAVYLVLHLISWFVTDQPNDTGLLATIYNNRLIWYLLIGYSLVLLTPKPGRARTFAKVLLIVSTVVCAVGIAQRFLPADIMTHFGYGIERGTKPNFFIDDKPDLPRIFSTIRDPNSLGAFLILPGTLILLALIRFWDTRKRQLLIGLFLLHGLALLLTFSRSAWIGVFLADAIVLAFAFRSLILLHARKLVVAAVLLLVVAGGLIFVLRDQYFVQNVFFHADESTTLTDPNELRVELFQKGVDGIADNPGGNGPGTAGLVSTRLPNGLLTENYYLQIAYEVGIFGLLLFLGFLYLILRRLWENRQSMVAQALLASFVGLALMNWLLHTWANEAVAASWFMLAGLMMRQEPKAIKVVKQKLKTKI